MMMSRKVRPASLFILALCLSAHSAAAQPCIDDGVVTKIRASIQSRYPSRDPSDISSVKLSYQRPSHEIVKELEGLGFNVVRFNSRETSEVSQSYSVKLREGTKAWRLCISGVGLYVVLFRLGKDERLESITSATLPERRLIKYMNDGGYTVLNTKILKCPTGLKSVGRIKATNALKIVIWQGLFRWEDAAWLSRVR